jgi:hypothetical protein
MIARIRNVETAPSHPTEEPTCKVRASFRQRGGNTIADYLVKCELNER